MTQVDPPEMGGTIQERHAHLALSLNRYVAEIERILAQLMAGDFDELGQVPKLKREMMSVAKQLRDAEIECDQQAKHDAGQLGVGDIDLDAMRDKIGGRLDRLRAATGTGGVFRSTRS